MKLAQPLARQVLDAVRPVPASGPVPGVDWVDHVEADPIRALESFALRAPVPLYDDGALPTNGPSPT
ncbi:hypothetical protein ABZ669_33135 [Streptomyces hirsutus]|uniref:hypothetical protein n=1 Tax=Streptomyces hirsutus TaxID=35620 RepID=UPI0033FB05D8